MTKLNHLSIVNDAINIPGVAFRRNAVSFDRRLNIEQLAALARQVAEMHGGTAWWLGDVGLEIQARNSEENEAKALKKDAEVKALERELEHVEGKDRKAVRERIRGLEAEAAALRDPKGDHYTALAEALGITPGYWKNCVLVCRFFKPSCRHDGLSIAHHYEAIRGAEGTDGNMSDAKRWLDRAAAEQWATAELRKQVNLSLASAPRPTEEPFENEWEPIEHADKWAITHKDAPMSAEKARALLSRWQALIEFVEKLKRVAGAA